MCGGRLSAGCGDLTEQGLHKEVQELIALPVFGAKLWRSCVTFCQVSSI